MDAIIISNNQLCLDSLSDRHQIVYITGTPMEVLIRVRNEIHKGRGLLTHPFMGNFRPGESPFLSVAVSCSAWDKTDSASLITIENSIEMIKAKPGKKPESRWDEAILKDFRLVDFDMIKTALEIG